jgi:RNA polymerase sigma-70 factor (ECF subfamily)
MGDLAAFDALIRRYQQRMYAICRRVTCDDNDALDALQEALLQAWRHMDSFAGDAQVGTWLYRVATNAAIDEVRRRARRPQPSDQLPEVPAPQALQHDQVADRLTIDWALAQLPPQFRVAIVLREYLGLSYLEIAEVREIPVDTVKSQISRGRQALAKLLRIG